MKTRTIIPIMVIGCILLATVGYAQKATVTTNNLVTIDLIDCTGRIPVTKTVQMTSSEWIMIQQELNSIRSSGLSAQDAFNAQAQVLADHHLIASTNAKSVTSHFAATARLRRGTPRHKGRYRGVPG